MTDDELKQLVANISFPTSSLGMHGWKLCFPCFCYLHNEFYTHQAELEGRHSQAGAWERGALGAFLLTQQGNHVVLANDEAKVF